MTAIKILSDETQGGRLRRARLQAGLSSRQLGAMIFCEESVIRSKELGYRDLSEHNLRMIRENTPLNADWIRTG